MTPKSRRSTVQRPYPGLAVRPPRRKNHRSRNASPEPLDFVEVTREANMSRYEFEDGEPHVVIEKHEAGIGSFLLGIAIGAGVALMFAPRSGAATRRSLRRRAMRMRRVAEEAVADATENVTDSYQDARRKVEERLDSAREAIDVKRRQVNRAMDAGRAAAREARAELEQRIAETKAAYNAGEAVARNGRRSDDDELAESTEG